MDEFYFIYFLQKALRTQRTGTLFTHAQTLARTLTYAQARIRRIRPHIMHTNIAQYTHTHYTHTYNISEFIDWYVLIGEFHKCTQICILCQQKVAVDDRKVRRSTPDLATTNARKANASSKNHTGGSRRMKWAITRHYQRERKKSSIDLNTPVKLVN